MEYAASSQCDTMKSAHTHTHETQSHFEIGNILCSSILGGLSFFCWAVDIVTNRCHRYFQLIYNMNLRHTSNHSNLPNRKSIDKCKCHGAQFQFPILKSKHTFSSFDFWNNNDVETRALHDNKSCNLLKWRVVDCRKWNFVSFVCVCVCEGCCWYCSLFISFACTLLGHKESIRRWGMRQ